MCCIVCGVSKWTDSQTCRRRGLAESNIILRFGEDGGRRKFVVGDWRWRGHKRRGDVLSLRFQLVNKVLGVLRSAAQFQCFARAVRFPALTETFLFRSFPHFVPVSLDRHDTSSEIIYKWHDSRQKRTSNFFESINGYWRMKESSVFEKIR